MRQRDKRARRARMLADGFAALGLAATLVAGRYWHAQPHRCGDWRTGYCAECDPDPIP